jgi:hypothetical protein
MGDNTMNKVTTTQIGVVGVNLVCNTLIVQSRGRLSPFQPIADDDGIDILIYDKKTGRAVPAQVKCRTAPLKKPGREERGNIVHFEIRSAKCKTDDFAHLIAVLLSEDLKSIRVSWFIPMKDVRKIASKKAGKYVIRASKANSAKDKYTDFRCDSDRLLVDRIMCASNFQWK